MGTPAAFCVSLRSVFYKRALLNIYLLAITRYFNRTIKNKFAHHQWETITGVRQIVEIRDLAGRKERN